MYIIHTQKHLTDTDNEFSESHSTFDNLNQATDGTDLVETVAFSKMSTLGMKEVSCEVMPSYGFNQATGGTDLVETATLIKTSTLGVKLCYQVKLCSS